MNKTSVVHKLPKGTYTEHTIPKKNGKVRRICAPDADLLNWQRQKLRLLYGLFTTRANRYGVSEVFHGFVPDKNCVTAATSHIGYDMTLMMDISTFFDSIHNSKLSGLPLVGPENEGNSDSFYHAEGGYCAQGFATSPIIANIAIIPLVQEIQEFLNDYLGDNNYAFTIYADDIQISFNYDHRLRSNGESMHEYINDTSTGLYVDKVNDIISVVTACLTLEDLQVNRTKTRIRHSKYGYRRILGINVGKDHIRASRKTMRKIRAARHQKNGPSLGGLTTWSRCLPPRALRDMEEQPSFNPDGIIIDSMSLAQ